jgi:DNA-binding beta-propeller fold protein YncE
MSRSPIKSYFIAVLAVSACAVANAQSVKTTIALPSLPEGVAVNYATNRVYVALPSFGGPTDSLAVIDGYTDTVIQTITIPPVGYQVAVDMLKDKVYVGGCYQDSNGNNHCELAVVDGRTSHNIKTIPITETEGSGIQGLAVDALTGTVYVSNASDNVINVITCEGVKDKQISLDGETPVGVAVDPFTQKLYVALATNLVDIVNTRTNKVLTSATIGETNGEVAVNWVTGNAFVTNTIVGPSTLGVLKGDGTVLANVAVGNTPFGVDVDPLTNLAFVTNTLDQTVSVVSGKTNAVTTTLPVSGLFVAANPFTSKVYVGGQTNSVTVIREK